MALIRQNEPDGFAQLIFECHPVCWSMVDLEEPLGQVKRRNCPQVLASPDTGVQLNCLNTSTTWNAHGCPLDVPLPALVGKEFSWGQGLKCLKWHQMLHCKLLRRVFHPVEEKLCVGVRVTWGVIAVLNQAILRRCHVNNFMSYPRAASEVWMHREFLLSSPTFPKSKDHTPHSSHTAGSKEGSTCRGEHWGGVLICLSHKRRAALDRAEV